MLSILQDLNKVMAEAAQRRPSQESAQKSDVYSLFNMISSDLLPLINSLGCTQMDEKPEMMDCPKGQETAKKDTVVPPAFRKSMNAIFPVIDDLERATAYLSRPGDPAKLIEQVTPGLSLIRRKLIKIVIGLLEAELGD